LHIPTPTSAIGYAVAWVRFRRKFGHVATVYSVKRQWTGEPQPYELTAKLRGKNNLVVTFVGLPEGDNAEARLTVNVDTMSAVGRYHHQKSGEWLSGEMTISITPDGSVVEDRRYTHHVDPREVPQAFVWTPK
jgi:hypothetical protein